MRILRTFVWVFACIVPTATGAAPSPCQIHLILFVPADVRAPAGYQRRAEEMVAYGEAFFKRELKRWGHAKAVMPFRRAPGGRVEVTVMRGKQKTSDYKPVAVRAEVMDELRRQDKLDGGRQVWWIMVYAGDPPARFSAFLGGFGPQIGGWAVCNFDTTPGRIDPAAPLGSDFLEKIALKGMIHELGHGLGLPHVGPLNRDDAGNTLMGPTHFNFKRVTSRREPRVYLSEAEAAMLAMHPAFRGVADDRGQLPKVEVREMKYAGDGRNRRIVVSGRVMADRRAAYALVADESDTRPGEYWTKTYVGKVTDDGRFEVAVSEPAESGGTLKTWLLFEDGSQTGNGRQRSRESGIAKAYTYDRGQWTFR